MTDRPILFSAPMIRALLEGRKTQTRRILSPRNVSVMGQMWGRNSPWSGLRFAEAESRGDTLAVPFWHPNDPPVPTEDCGVYRLYPIWQPGDRLWVREAFAIVGSVDPGWTLYRANGYEAECARHGFDKPYPDESLASWRPSIHMPRWASRLTLLVTDVRVQRLQEISSADAIAEGCPPYANSATIDCDTSNPRDDFKRLWNSIHGPDAWDANPWVAAISFRTIHANIDAIKEQP